MASFSVDGRMTVKTLKERFKETFGASLRVYVGNNAGRGAKHAADDARLGAIADERDSLSAIDPFDITSDMTVGDFEKAFQEKFDIAVQIADEKNEKLLDNDVKLLDVKG